MSLIPFSVGCTNFIGPSRSGKSFFIHKLIYEKDKMFERPANKVLYCYSVEQKEFEELKFRLGDDIIFHHGIPSRELVSEFATDNSEVNILVLDDLQSDCLRSGDVMKCYTELSHHLDLIVLMSCHNLFEKGKYNKTIGLSTNALCIFEQVRDVNQIRVLASQMYPGKTKEFLQVYMDATSHPFGYLIVNLNPNLGSHQYRLYTKVMPGENPIVYKI